MLIVIGGGIAGTSAAIHAAQAGLPVLLIEAGVYPRHKVCGEFLSPEARGYLDDLGVLPQVEARQPAALTRARVTASDGRVWTGDLPGTGIGISRYALDALLAQRARDAGVQVVTGEKVTGVAGDLTRGFTVSIRGDSVRARAVIAAYGRRSSLDRALNRPFMTRQHPYIGLKAHFCGESPGASVDLHAFPGGYCGISRIENDLINVCLLARLDAFQRCGSISAFVEWMASRNPYLRRFFAHAQRQTDWLSISQIPFTGKSAVEADILMTGDSAGMIAPLAGDGMSIALRSGEIAARHVGRFLRGEIDGRTLKTAYPREWRRQFGGRIRLGRVLQESLFTPPLLSFGLRLMNAAPALGSYFVKHTREINP